MTFPCSWAVLYSLRMHDLPSVMLLQQSHARRVGGEELELMGKQAADLYGRSEHTLSQAVVETVKKAGLSPEQVCRVVEFANTKAFLAEFAKEGSHKVVEFQGGPADPSLVMKELNDGGGGSVFDAGDGHYRAPPPESTKAASVDVDEEAAKEAAFEQSFLGAPEYPFVDPLADVYEVKEKLASAHKVALSEIETTQSDLMTVSDELFHEVKQGALNGVSLGQMVSAWSEVTDEPDFVKAAFVVLTPRLVDNGVFQSRDQVAESLEKTASSGVVNLDHPLVTTFSDFCVTLQKLAHYRAAANDIKPHLDEVTTFLKQAVSGAIPKAWKAVNQATQSASGPAGEIVGGAAKALIGEGAGKTLGAITEKGVAHAPKILAAYGGVKGHKHLERTSPAYNQALSVVPFTRQNAIRKQYRG